MKKFTQSKAKADDMSFLGVRKKFTFKPQLFEIVRELISFMHAFDRFCKCPLVTLYR